jgi:predicted SprT family Zn-dependent metalloprotease
MDKRKLLTLIERESVMIWDSLIEIYPTLMAYDVPKVKLNPYFWRCAGQCFQPENVIELGYKFFKSGNKNFNYMIDVILPHEIIHQADFNLFGDSEKICGHGERWCEIMVNYGLPAEKFHSMEIAKNA